MLQTVHTSPRSIDAYRGIAPDELLDELARVAADLRGVRLLQVNSTAYGGGVSELLRSGMPLLNGLGIVADWKIIAGDERFFEATKAIHNGLQGAERDLTKVEQATYLANAKLNASRLEEEYDAVIIHDPQPAPVPQLRGRGRARWIWRCHIDTSRPNPQVWSFVRGFLDAYDAAVFTLEGFVPPDLPIHRVEIIPPAIDPLSPKNLELPEAVARAVLEWTGIRLDRPFITQVSRFDPWKDPLGVIAAYRIVRERHPELQLAMVGSMALDDPEGWEVYRKVREESEKDPLVHVFTNLTGVGNIEVNAFQRLARVAVQKSIREGFGLVISEALWKGTPVVAGRAGGIPLQMADGTGGILVDSVEGCATAILELLDDRARARDLGRSGRERVRRQFLLPRLLLNELALVRALLSDRMPIRRTWEPGRDPVCGMMVSGEPALTAEHAGRTFVFCAEECRRAFLASPERYG